MNLDWPPPYTLKRSARAKRLNLKLCPQRGLQLVLPKRCSEKEAIAFLESNKAWVLKHQNLLPKLNQSEIILPDQINLLALNKSWQIRYEEVNAYKKIKLLHLPNELVLYGEKLAFENCTSELNQWLYLIAEVEFGKWLRKLSDSCNLPFNKLTIRNQLTRWGSCSKEKNINLNVKLLFLPKAITEYILIHELCHTKHLDHSIRFWRLVESFVPNYRHLISELKRFNHNDFPDWLS